MAKYDMGNKMRDYLIGQVPLTILTLKDLYDRLAEGGDDDEKSQVRYQLYRHSLGNKAALHSPPSEYLAIQVEFKDDEDEVWKVFLSLPAIKRSVFVQEIGSTEVERMQGELEEYYGAETVRYWVVAAQRRSVDLIRSSMEEAKTRSDEKCSVCKAMIDLGYQISNQNVGFHAAHIISRHTIFWESVYNVHQVGLEIGQSIFSDKGVEAIQQTIRNNELHSDPRYMLGLCRTHDRAIQQTITSAIEELMDRLNSGPS